MKKYIYTGPAVNKKVIRGRRSRGSDKSGTRSKRSNEGTECSEVMPAVGAASVPLGPPAAGPPGCEKGRGNESPRIQLLSFLRPFSHPGAARSAAVGRTPLCC